MNIVKDFVNSKKRWLEKYLKDNRLSPADSFKKIYYLGKLYKLKIIVKKGVKKGIVQKEDNGISLIINSNIKKKEEYVRKLLIGWYKNEGLHIIRERVEYYCSRFNDVRNPSPSCNCIKKIWSFR